MTNLNKNQYDTALAKLLSDRDLRILFWRIIVEDCRVFQEDFPTNASAYCLLAKQEIGKRILADAKAVDPDAVLAAEKEYNAFMEQVERAQELKQQEEGDY